MGKGIATGAVVLGLVLPAGASATPSHYFPKPHHGCRTGYVRKVNRQKRVWCVQKPRIATTVSVLSSPDYSGGPNYNWSDSVSAGVYYDSGNNALDGVPLRFGVVNDVTGKTVASFSGVSNVYRSCSIVVSLDSAGNTETLTGQAVAPDPACPLSQVTVPANSASLLVTFVGNAKYAPSSKTGTL